jgi:hypothetical protein
MKIIFYIIKHIIRFSIFAILLISISDFVYASNQEASTSGTGAVCGNGIIESGEQCDTGGSNGTCPATCSVSCTTNPCGSNRSGGDNRKHSPSTSPSLAIIEHVEVYNKPLVILSEQESILTKESPAGLVTIEVPSINLEKKIILDLVIQSIATNKNIIPTKVDIVDGLVHDIIIKDENGNLLQSLSVPMTVILPLPAHFIENKKLGVYWLDEINKEWILIPNTTIADNKVTFQINYPAKLTIFSSNKSVLKTSKEIKLNLLTSLNKKSVLNKIDNQSAQQNDIIFQQKLKEFVVKKVKSFVLSIFHKFLPFKNL